MSEPITDAELDAIEARAKAATLGPWYFRDSRLGDTIETALHKADVIKLPPSSLAALTIDPRDGEFIDPRDGEFIAHAREDVPRLEQEVRRLRAQLAAIREKAAPIIEFERMSSAGAGQPQDWQIDLTDSGARLTASGLRALADTLKEFP